MLNQIAAIHGTGVAASTNSYESIATVTPSGTGVVTFSSIPSTYKHLQLRFLARSTRADAYGYFKIQFNSDTTASYSLHNLSGNGSATSASAFSSQTSINGYQITGNNATSNTFSGGVLDVLDYADTNKYKTVRVLYGDDVNGTGAFGQGYIFLNSGLWQKTNAISSITITDEFNNFATNSSFALYGIKG